jgi:hypothetical protein
MLMGYGHDPLWRMLGAPANSAGVAYPHPNHAWATKPKAPTVFFLKRFLTRDTSGFDNVTDPPDRGRTGQPITIV